MGYTKWIFGTLGFALSGTPIGAVVGFALGSLFDNVSVGRQANDGSDDPRARSTAGGQRAGQQTATAGDVALSLVVLTAAVMKADGKATQGELGHARTFFNKQFGPQHAAELLRLLRDMLQRSIPLRDVCEQMRGHLTHPERLQLLHYLIGLAYSDGQLDHAERQVILNIAYYLGISEKDREAVPPGAELVREFHVPSHGEYNLRRIFRQWNDSPCRCTPGWEDQRGKGRGLAKPRG